MLQSNLSSTSPSTTESTLWKAFFGAKTPQEKSHAHRQLMEFYLPLVVQITKKLSIRIRQQIEKEELLSMGMLGLYRAIESFSPSRQVKFSTYAYPKIRGAILDGLRAMDPLSRKQRQDYHRICKFIHQFSQQHGRPPETQEIAQGIQMDETEVIWLMECAGRDIYWVHHQPMVNPTPDSPWEVSSNNIKDLPWYQTDLQILKERLKMAFHQLPKRDQQLLYLRHYMGLRGCEIAQVLGISPGRVTQLYNEALVKLKALIEPEPPES